MTRTRMRTKERESKSTKAFRLLADSACFVSFSFCIRVLSSSGRRCYCSVLLRCHCHCRCFCCVWKLRNVVGSLTSFIRAARLVCAGRLTLNSTLWLNSIVNFHSAKYIFSHNKLTYTKRTLGTEAQRQSSAKSG